MRHRHDVTTPSLDWQRITALSGSFTAHAIVAVLIALPLVRPLQREVPRVFEAVFVEPTRPLPPPPPTEPLPPTRARPTAQPPARSLPTPTPIAPAQNPTLAPSEGPPTTPTLEAPAGGAPSDAPPAAGGATRTLAYDGALKLRYPPESLRRHEQGLVLLRVLVDADGTAQRVEIERGCGHPRLDAAARDAVRRARFRPVLQDGRAVAAWGVVPIEFRLDRG